jgi:hypothetical protein
MATALNVFRTVTANILTYSNVLYTAPYAVTSILLSVQVTNVTSNTVSTTFYHSTAAGLTTELSKDFDIPTKDSASIVSGKLVLETGQSIVGSASANGALKAVISLLETAND